jgi:hypothetical protein
VLEQRLSQSGLAVEEVSAPGAVPDELLGDVRALPLTQSVRGSGRSAAAESEVFDAPDA